MVFSYKEKAIIKYLQIKYKYDATAIVNEHPKYEWNVNGVKKLLKKIDETNDVAQKEGSGQSVCREEKIELVWEMILSQQDQPGTHFTPAEIALELNTDCQSVSHITDQDLDLCFSEEIKGAKTYWFKHWKANDSFKKVAVKVYLENITNCILWWWKDI